MDENDITSSLVLLKTMVPTPQSIMMGKTTEESKVQYKHRFINAALRGAATLRARLQKGHPATTFVLAEEKVEECRESNISTALNFACSGGELLKRTRKGALHWKQVSFNINSKWQVVAKMKSKYMAVAFTKKKKYAISGVQSDVPAWPRREIDDGSEQKAYFGIITADRIIEFECKSKDVVTFDNMRKVNWSEPAEAPWIQCYALYASKESRLI
ncbi:hypothetical protein HS088_TW04G00209 [Tripterygium wilfordii]|uniref:Pleckstrin-like plant domain-containing protein n=1 Tax=Tripterygium wilfordii TaxID=458696 RepID=A0A7J7DPL7_TRIWF|nr:hypothetical protein HS088_TW04G00209 [Tripterygium wilfordii]